MKFVPVISEKSLQNAKVGKYTFKVDRGLTKHQIKKLIEEAFGVHVTNVNTINLRGEVKRTMAGRKKVVKPVKKAIVVLRDKEKIDIFETKE
uniref:Large ribosomal subunit protein uL23 n=1 Tax=uncultured Microgenomates bacterium Rifle_16ft_4_minimus_5036 TaxID=1665119 RepID=A0A0H4TBU5_9BACT|nr:50S ribosomal protein L23, large subunit ribosomal protein L23 [uncultured Microgenomates bacterium Rifle_16ft_4_minimus_5036]